MSEPYEFESEDIISDDDDDFESVFPRLQKKEWRKTKEREPMNYEWLIDILPDKLLKDNNVAKFGKIKDWMQIRTLFDCQEVIIEAYVKKLFFACLCKNSDRKYFVSYIKLGHIKNFSSIRDIEYVKSVKGPVTTRVTYNRFLMTTKEIIIALKLSFLHNKIGRFPICRNFVKTFYATKRVVNSKFGYFVLQEELEMTLFEYVKVLKKELNDMTETKSLKTHYKNHEILFKKYSNQQDDPNTPNEMLSKLEHKKDEQEELMKDITFKLEEIVHNYTYEKIMLCYFQIIYGFYVADEIFKEFIHGDLHPANVMISKIKDKDFDGFTFIVNKNLIFKLPKYFNLRVVIIDFNRSHIRHPVDYKKTDDYGVYSMFSVLFDNLFGYYFDETAGVANNFTIEQRLKSKKRYDLQRLHYGILLKKLKPGISYYLGMRPTKLFDKFNDEKLMVDDNFYLNLLKDPEFKRYQVKNVKNPSPKYTVEFQRLQKPMTNEMYIDPNYIFCPT